MRNMKLSNLTKANTLIDYHIIDHESFELKPRECEMYESGVFNNYSHGYITH